MATPDQLLPVIAERLRTLRHARMASQRSLAQDAHLSRRTIEEVEAGRQMPSAAVIVALAQALQCSTDDLLLARAHENDRSHSTDSTNATP